MKLNVFLCSRKDRQIRFSADIRCNKISATSFLARTSNAIVRTTLEYVRENARMVMRAHMDPDLRKLDFT